MYNKRTFARRVLKRVGIQPTNHAVQALIGWENAEGGHWHNDARYNPLNTTQPMPGAGNTGTQGNIKVYRSPKQGIRATARTLENGNYGGILSALKNGSAHDVAAAIDASPWGTHGSLVYNTIASAPKGAGGGGGSVRVRSPRRNTRTTTTTSTDPDARKMALLQYVENRDDPDALLNLAADLKNARSTTSTTTRVRRPAQNPSQNTSQPNVPAGQLPAHRQASALYELFWQGPGGINVKLGQPEPQGFVDGHTDHVHVAANPKAIVKIGKIAQEMGLHVGENPHFGGVNPVHVSGSYHYKNEAIDVSGDTAKMRKFAHKVARIYGVN